MTRFAAILGVAGFLAVSAQANAADVSSLLPALKQGGHVIVFRHGATDNSQQDAIPLNFENMAAQRQLSDKGRETARQLGSALKRLGIPISKTYTSKLNRAVETGKLLSGGDVVAMAELTDSGAGSTSAMAGPAGGGNPALGRALRQLANTPPAAATNVLIVTHKTNIIDAFGKGWSDVGEGEASIFKPDSAGGPTLAARVQPGDWIKARN